MRKYYFNFDYFENIDSQEKAYWLGFLAADGTICSGKKRTCIKLALKTSDDIHLQKFRNAIGSNSPIHFFKNNGSGAVQIVCCSPKMTADLAVFGIVPRKSATLKWPKISQEFVRHFARGYFDGDGCFWNSKTTIRCSYSVLGTPLFMRDLMKILCKQCDLQPVKTFKRYPDCPVSHFHFCGKDNCRKIFNFFYDGATIYMDRKKNKAQQFLFGVSESPMVPADSFYETAQSQ